MQKIITKSKNETIELGESIVSRLHGGEVVALFGELGAGKTTFVQGMAKGLRIKRRILSPTFIIVRHYPIANNKSFNVLYHIDLYRLKDPQELQGLGLTELFASSDSIVVVEWPERLGTFLPQKRREIYFKYISDQEREIKWTT